MANRETFLDGPWGGLIAFGCFVALYFGLVYFGLWAYRHWHEYRNAILIGVAISFLMAGRRKL